jgi:protein-S-isoprenylcysteine O-methyltransferase Ste14
MKEVNPMPLAALTGYLVYLALAFGLRAFVHYRRTGATGYVGLSGRTFSTEWWAGVLFAGLLMLTPNVLAAASLVALLIALEIQVRAVEEPYLLRTHGDAYRRYAAETGRFVPGIGRLV